MSDLFELIYSYKDVSLLIYIYFVVYEMCWRVKLS